MLQTKIESVIKSKIKRFGDIDWEAAKNFQQKGFKKQSSDEKAKLKASLKANGFRTPFYVWENGDNTYLIDGHHRQAALHELRLDGYVVPQMLPAIFIDASSMHDAKKTVLVLNSHYAQITKSGVVDFLDGMDLQSALGDMRIPGLNLDSILELDDITGADTPELPSETDVRAGDLYILGAHRLLCGDSTIHESFNRLMAGEKARLICTDPPYGVSLSSVKAGMARFERNQVGKPIESDDLVAAELQEFLEAVFRGAVPHLEHAAWYLWHAHLTQGFFAAAAAAAAADVILHRQIIWKKNGLVFTRSGMYHWSHEPAFYGWQKGKPPQWLGEKNQTSVWEIAHDEKKDKTGHPTQKPVELFVIPIRNHLKRGQIALEPFAGSGSQLIAAEQTGRRCFAIEKDPLYCDLIIQRWEKLTGGKAKKE